MSKRSHTFKALGAKDPQQQRHDLAVQIRKVKGAEHIRERRKIDQTLIHDLLASTKVDPNGSAEKLARKTSELLDKLPFCLELLTCGDPAAAQQGAKNIRQLLSMRNNTAPIKEVLAASVLPLLVQYLAADGYRELQFECAWAITNIASGSSSDTRAVVDAGAVPLLSFLMNSPDSDVREQAAWALGNISGDNIAFRDMVIETGAMGPIFEVLANTHLHSGRMVQTTTWVLSNLCRGLPGIPLRTILIIIPVLGCLITMDDTEVVRDACWALSYVSEGAIDQIVQSGMCPRLVDLLKHGDEFTKTAALRVVGNIVSGSDCYLHHLFSAGLLSGLKVAMGSIKTTLAKEACWVIANILAGPAEDIGFVLDAGILPLILHHLSSENMLVKKEAVWAVHNAQSSASPEQMAFIVQNGTVAKMCKVLYDRDVDTLHVVLDFIRAMLVRSKKDTLDLLEEVNAIDQIEELTMHADDTICVKASKLISETTGDAEFFEQDFS